jgi:hypothetical protein
MRSRTRTTSPAVGSAPASGGQRPTALARIDRIFGSIIDWLRTGYPDEAPRTGHSPLLALNGPLALSARQTAQIVAELGEKPTEPIDIEVAITKVTNQLPTATQTCTVTRALQPDTPHDVT